MATAIRAKLAAFTFTTAHEIWIRFPNSNTRYVDSLGAPQPGSTLRKSGSLIYHQDNQAEPPHDSGRCCVVHQGPHLAEQEVATQYLSSSMVPTKKR